MNDTPRYDLGLVWLRRDLRLEDNTALHHALKCCREVQLVFVFDPLLLQPLPRNDRRVGFIHTCLASLDGQLRQCTGDTRKGLVVLHDRPTNALGRLARDTRAGALFTNHDDDPYALRRDADVRRHLSELGVDWYSFKDHTIFERLELRTAIGTPYRVFTPYRDAWLKQVTTEHLAERNCQDLQHRCARLPGLNMPLPSLTELGFNNPSANAPPIPGGRPSALQLLDDFWQRVDHYHSRRDFPALRGPSYLGAHLRFGTVSVRELMRRAKPLADSGSNGAASWVNELIWREFFAQILSNFPHVCQGCFKSEYDALSWEEGPTAEARFAAWCEGRTGYPLVDAAMRQLTHSGYMHNRLRMVTASFLVKHLGIDWRRGEAFFARHLLDFDLASNNGGWQWASSTGCDAQPYFRIFNPIAQSRKFDPQGKFILRYLPELNHAAVNDLHAPWLGEVDARQVVQATGYPAPIVDLASARARTLLRYAAIAKPRPRNSRAPD